jgi:sarcosine oxidase subunit delta
MRINCPCCGERDVSEFAYLGDGTVVRPAPTVEDAASRFFEYVYVRRNPAGPHHEYWYHAMGCRCWLLVTRNTVTHEILDTIRAADPARKRDGSNTSLEPTASESTF